MATPPVIGTLPGGKLVLFAADVDGKLWYDAQAAPNWTYGGWRSLGDKDLVGGLSVVNLDTAYGSSDATPAARCRPRSSSTAARSRAGPTSALA
jgi:hypothetical protein